MIEKLKIIKKYSGFYIAQYSEGIWDLTAISNSVYITMKKFLKKYVPKSYFGDVVIENINDFDKLTRVSSLRVVFSYWSAGA